MWRVPECVSLWSVLSVHPGQSSPLSPFFKEIVTVLLSTAQRHDPNQMESTRLQLSAFEAINDMVRAASPDTLDIVGQLTPVFLQEIVQTFSMAVQSGEQREKQAELQGQLCGVLQVCTTCSGLYYW